MTPSVAARALTVATAIAVAAGVFWIPVQVSDSLEILERTDALPTVRDAFVAGLSASPTMLRPLRQVQTKLLLSVAHRLGDRYHLAFRGYHAVGAAIVVLLFGALARPRSWPEVAALAFALTVLTGLHTFAGMMREAYPVNHFLLIAIAVLATLRLSRSTGGILIDIASVSVLALAALTLESGLLVFVAAAAAYIGGERGISRRALMLMVIVLVAYAVVRVEVLGISGASLGDRATGWGTRMLSAADQQSEFADRRWLLYGYTIVSSASTVLLSQPVDGQWTAVAAYADDRWMPVHGIEIATSVAATALVGWFFRRRTASGRRRCLEPLPLAMIAVLAGSALMSYAYAKSEIMSAAGVLYAVVVYAAAADALTVCGARERQYGSLMFALAAVLALGWGVRAVALQYKLQRSAYEARQEWVRRLPPYENPHHPLRLMPALRQEALLRNRTNYYMLSSRAERYFGE